MCCSSQPSQRGGRSSRPRPVEGGHARLRACAGRGRIPGARAGRAAISVTISFAVAIPDTGSGADHDQFRDLGGQPGAQPRLQLPGAARQPGDQRLQPELAQQSGWRRRIRSRARSALPQLGRALWPLDPKRRPGRLCRRQAQHRGRRRRLRRADRASREHRLLDRPEPHQNRRAARHADGDARSDAARLHRRRRQGTMDLGDRAGARLRQCRLQPRHRLWLRECQLRRAHRRRADRARLLLDQGAEPHRAQGRARMGALHDRLAAGGRRLRSTDGDGGNLRADARA